MPTALAIPRMGRREGAGVTGRMMRSFTDGAGTDGAGTEGAGATGAGAGPDLVEEPVAALGGVVAALAAVAAGFRGDGAGRVRAAAIWGRPPAPVRPFAMTALKGAGWECPRGAL